MGEIGIKADPGLGVVFMRTRKAQEGGRFERNGEESRVPFGYGDLRGLFNRVDGQRKLDTGSWGSGLWPRAQTSIWVLLA